MPEAEALKMQQMDPASLLQGVLESVLNIATTKRELMIQLEVLQAVSVAGLYNISPLQSPRVLASHIMEADNILEATKEEVKLWEVKLHNTTKRAIEIHDLLMQTAPLEKRLKLELLMQEHKRDILTMQKSWMQQELDAMKHSKHRHDILLYSPAVFLVDSLEEYHNAAENELSMVSKLRSITDEIQSVVKQIAATKELMTLEQSSRRLLSPVLQVSQLSIVKANVSMKKSTTAELHSTSDFLRDCLSMPTIIQLLVVLFLLKLKFRCG